MQPDFTHASTERLQNLSASLESTKHLAQLQHGRESLDAADVSALRDLADTAVLASDVVVELPETPVDETGPQALVETVIQPLQVAVEAELASRGDSVDTAQDVLVKQVKAIRALRETCTAAQLKPFLNTVLFHVGYYGDDKFPIGTDEEIDTTLTLLESTLKEAEELEAEQAGVATGEGETTATGTTDTTVTDASLENTTGGEAGTGTHVGGSDTAGSEGTGGTSGDGRLAESGKVLNNEDTGNKPPPEEIP